MSNVIFLQHFPPANLQKVPAGLVEKYTNILPKQLLNLWQESGLGTYGKGFLQLINPDEYREVLHQWLQQPDVGIRIPFALSAFGDIFYWRHLELPEPLEDGTKWAFDVCFLDPHNSMSAMCTYTMGEFLEEYFEDEMIKESFTREALFEEAVAKEGPLLPNEIYYFVPALRLGGEETIEHIGKSDARVHLNFLYQLVAEPDEDDEDDFSFESEDDMGLEPWETILYEIYEDPSQFEPAVQILEAALTPDSPAADYFTLGKLYEKYPAYTLEDFDEQQAKTKVNMEHAERFYLQALAKDRNEETLLALGDLHYYNAPDFSAQSAGKANEYYDAYIAEAQNGAKGFAGKALVAGWTDDYNTVIDNYKQALQQEPDNALYRASLAGAYKNHSQYELALSTYEEAIMQETEAYNRERMRLEQAACYIPMGQPQRAESIIAELAASATEHYERTSLFAAAGSLFEAEALHEQAISYYQKALEEGEVEELTKLQLLYSISSNYSEMGNYEQALQFNNEIINSEATEGYYYRLRGEIYEGLNKPAEALDAYKKALEIDATTPGVEARIAELSKDKEGGFFSKLFGS